MRLIIIIFGVLYSCSFFSQSTDSITLQNIINISKLKSRIWEIENPTTNNVDKSTNKLEDIKIIEQLEILKDSIIYLQKELVLSRKMVVDLSVKKVNKPILKLYFDSGKSTLSLESKSKLDSMNSLLKEDYLFLVLKGYTDIEGSTKGNQILSNRRTVEVRNYLLSENKIDQEKIIMNWFGSQNQIEGSLSENRRVEISFVR